MALLYLPSPHEYRLDGPLVPSNTGVLRAQRLIRLDGIPAGILARARARGAAVHQLIHYHNESDLDRGSIDPAYAPYLTAWERCLADRHLTPLLCEYRIASRRHRIAGTLDL